MRELQTGVWHWEAPHPDWNPGANWDQLVSSYAIDDGNRLLLFDPLALPSEIEELAAGRKTAIVLTCPWHRRDAGGLAERLVLWVERSRALVAGDTFINSGDGVEFPDWANVGVPPEQILEPLLALPVELVLPTHGAHRPSRPRAHALLTSDPARGQLYQRVLFSEV